MKVRLVTKAYRNAINHIRAARPDGVANPDFLKREVSLAAIISFHLEQPTESDDKTMFHCFRPENHTNGDADASLWCYDDYHGTGMGRWGCPTCEAGGDDVFGFLMKLHGYTLTEAIRWVKVWHMNHRGRITVRLRRRTR